MNNKIQKMDNTFFLNQSMVFTERSLYFIHNNEDSVVMDICEDSLMKRTAELLIMEGDDVLEIGFGMGIFSDYVQSKNIKTHVIVESHPEVFEKLVSWSENKTNVNPIFGDWIDVLPEILSRQYDSVYFDTHYDFNTMFFLKKIQNNIKKNGRYSRYTLDSNDTSAFSQETHGTGFKVLYQEEHQIEVNKCKNDTSPFSIPICILSK
jgi:protein arginine N-methyltransferase 2